MASHPIISQRKAPSHQPQMTNSSLMAKKLESTEFELIMPKREQLSVKKDQERLFKKFKDELIADQVQEEEGMRKISKRLKKENSFQNSYIKLNSFEVNLLEESFEMNNYPSVEEMQEIADKLGVNMSKIENWFKHHRRSLAKKGQFDIKTKRYFRENELEILMDVFKKTNRPSQQQMYIIAKQLNCTISQIKNWYSNKRKRVRFQAKSQGNKIQTEDSHFCPSSDSPNPSTESPIDLERPNQISNSSLTTLRNAFPFEEFKEKSPLEPLIFSRNIHANLMPSNVNYLRETFPSQGLSNQFFFHNSTFLPRVNYQNNFSAKLIAQIQMMPSPLNPQSFQGIFIPHQINSLGLSLKSLGIHESTAYSSLNQNPVTHIWQ